MRDFRLTVQEAIRYVAGVIVMLVGLVGMTFLVLLAAAATGPDPYDVYHHDMPIEFRVTE